MSIFHKDSESKDLDSWINLRVKVILHEDGFYQGFLVEEQKNGILILLPILKKKGISYQWIYFLIGFSLGLVSDEADLLLSIGSAYTLRLYDNPINFATDLILILTFFRLSQNHSYINGLLYDSETVL